MLRIFVWVGLLIISSSLPLAAAPFKVVTTVAPITDMVEQVGGKAIEVTGVIPQGRNSHTFEPSPSHAKIINEAQLIIANGLHLEIPILKLAEKVKQPKTSIIRLGNATLKQQDWKYDFSFPKAKGHPNPHLWPNLSLAQRYVDVITKALSAQLPDLQETFNANATRYKKTLEKLDHAIGKCMVTILPDRRKLVTYHDSFAYYAPRYGMKVIGAIQPADFAQPSPKEVAKMIVQLRQEKVPAIFGSEVFPSTVLAQIAREAGTVYVDKLRDDSFPGKLGDPEHSFVGMMVLNAKTITTALKGDPHCMDKFSND